MKKLLTIFSLIFFVSCGIVYANNDASDANGNAIEISGLGGRNYLVTIIVTNPLLVIPVVTIFSFDESGDFTAFEILCEKYSGYYTQTGSTFNAHCGCYGFKDLPHEMDFEGTSISDIFIYGSITGCIYDDCGEGVFIGILKLFQAEAE